MKLFKEDLSSAIVVFLVALPLCLGISLASGAPLMSGLISGIIGGIFVGALSGSQMSVSGPAAGLATVVLASIGKLGSFETFSLALILAGLIQLAGGLCKAGVIAKYIPSNVIKGLLASIGLLLILKQVPHALGYDVAHEDTFSFSQPNGENTFTHFFGTFSHFTEGAMVIGAVSIMLLIWWDKKKKGKKRLIPGAVLVVLTGIAINEIFRALGSNLFLSGEHLVAIPQTGLIELFRFQSFSLAGLQSSLVWTTAITLAVVASLETLLNLEAVDKLDPHKRESPPNRELMAQGLGNMLAGFLGGLPVTSVIVRSSVNIDAGAKSKFSAIIHGFLLLVSILTLTSLMNRIPLASLAAILIMTGYKLASPSLFREMLGKGPNQYFPFFATIVGILFTDLLVGVVIGLGISIFFLLKSNLRNPFSVEKEHVYHNETIRIELPNQVSFLNKGTIKDTLWSVPPGARVIIDAGKADYIDADVLDILEDFKSTIVPEREIKLNMIGLKESYELSDHVQFINVLDKKTQAELTPAMILQFLKEGNERFLNGRWSKKEFLHQVNATSLGQSPMAVILSCIDSRTTPEIIFDTNLGDVLSMRIAGNIVSEEIIGSVELSCSKLGTKLIVVMGHSNCGAIGAAANALREGKITTITDKIEPAVNAARAKFPGLAAPELIEKACAINIQNSIQEILNGSPSIRELIQQGKIGIVPAYYDTLSGKVQFNP